MSAELIGWLAGLLTLSSSLPQIKANIANPELARHQSTSRNLLLCAGNSLWLVYAIIFNVAAMMFFAALGATLAGALFIQVVRAKLQYSK